MQRSLPNEWLLMVNANEQINHKELIQQKRKCIAVSRLQPFGRELWLAIKQLARDCPPGANLQLTRASLLFSHYWMIIWNRWKRRPLKGTARCSATAVAKRSSAINAHICLQCAFIRRSRSHSLEECVREREGKTGVTTETSWQDDRDDSSSFFCAPQLAADLEQ